jgi:hypothetical protein
MRKVLFVAIVWTLLLAIPFTALAIVASAQISLHLTAIATWISGFANATTGIGRVWILEFAERWPEAAGMVVGMLVILATLWVARSNDKTETADNPARK